MFNTIFFKKNHWKDKNPHKNTICIYSIFTDNRSLLRHRLIKNYHLFKYSKYFVHHITLTTPCTVVSYSLHCIKRKWEKLFPVFLFLAILFNLVQLEQFSLWHKALFIKSPTEYYKFIPSSSCSKCMVESWGRSSKWFFFWGSLIKEIKFRELSCWTGNKSGIFTLCWRWSMCSHSHRRWGAPPVDVMCAGCFCRTCKGNNSTSLSIFSLEMGIPLVLL